MDINRIRIAINSCDPIELLEHAPTDEYEDEIQEIACEIERHSLNVIQDILAAIVAKVFARAFGADMVDLEICERIASLILN